LDNGAILKFAFCKERIAQLEENGDFEIKRLVGQVKQLEAELKTAYEQGKLDLLPKIEAIEAIIEKTHDIGQVAVELYRLKSQLERDAIQQKVNYRKALENAKEQGKLDQREEILKSIMKHKNCNNPHKIDFHFATCLDVVIDEFLKKDWERLYPKKAERLKSQLSNNNIPKQLNNSKSEGAK
jgi:viroplasmin and RNaseH domain-containing protein